MGSGRLEDRREEAAVVYLSHTHTHPFSHLFKHKSKCYGKGIDCKKFCRCD